MNGSEQAQPISIGQEVFEAYKIAMKRISEKSTRESTYTPTIIRTPPDRMSEIVNDPAYCSMDGYGYGTFHGLIVVVVGGLNRVEVI